MRLSRHLAATLAGLSLGLALGGWSAAALGAEGGTAASAAPAVATPPVTPQAPAVAPAAAEQPAAPQASAPAQPAPEPPAAQGESAATATAPAAAPETKTEASADLWYPPVPPPSLQTLVDQRRDAIRDRRKAMYDGLYGGYGYMPPGWADYRWGMDRYRDAMRALYRQQRDFSRQYHNSWLDAFCPWSKPERDWREMRNYATQMDQLDWQEYRNAFPYGRPWGYGAPIPW
jgi:hypothetical protein